jgi:hypothetical protein
MPLSSSKYKALVSSDWSECLSPNGPFDPISFNYPHLKSELTDIFRQYTGNSISLTAACSRIREICPELLDRDQMDAYLKQGFQTYKGIADLMEWCLGKDILFMLNTTGTQGYFQRCFALKLLPPIPVVAGNPLISFPDDPTSHRYQHQVLEIEDKPKCTEAVMRLCSLTADKVVIMGDSGGDGPHFKWGADNGAFLVGNMTKASLSAFCDAAGITIGKRFGVSYTAGEPREPEREMNVDYMDLTEAILMALKL